VLTIQRDLERCADLYRDYHAIAVQVEGSLSEIDRQEFRIAMPTSGTGAPPCFTVTISVSDAAVGTPPGSADTAAALMQSQMPKINAFMSPLLWIERCGCCPWWFVK